LQKGHYPAGEDINMLDHWAGAGTGSALITLLEILTADLPDLFAKLVVRFAC